MCEATVQHMVSSARSSYVSASARTKLPRWSRLRVSQTELGHPGTYRAHHNHSTPLPARTHQQLGCAAQVRLGPQDGLHLGLTHHLPETWGAQNQDVLCTRTHLVSIDLCHALVTAEAPMNLMVTWLRVQRVRLQ